MAINGVNSFYGAQFAMNNYRLASALSNNNKYMQAISGANGLSSISSFPALNNSSLSSAISRYMPTATSFDANTMKSNLNFVKNYNSNMTDLMRASNSLRNVNKAGAMSDLAVTSSNKDVASAVERMPARTQKSISLNVKQLAEAQSNISKAVDSGAAAKGNMDFNVSSITGSMNVKVSATDDKGAEKTNLQMLQEAADKINSNSKTGVKASVVTDSEKGTSQLKIESAYIGSARSFNVSGDMGIASGADQVDKAAANALYEVKSDGMTRSYQSSTNDVSVDNYRIGVTLNGVGEATIKTGLDPEKVGNSVQDLVDAYNSSINFLNENYERGTGVDTQLRNLVNGLGDEKSMSKIGIDINKDATMTFDKETFAKAMNEDSNFVQNLLSGSNGIANTAFNKALTGMRTNSVELTNGNTSSTSAASDNSDTSNSINSYLDKLNSNSNPYKMFAMYSRTGAYNLSNYYAVGAMMNFFA